MFNLATLGMALQRRARVIKDQQQKNLLSIQVGDLAGHFRDTCAEDGTGARLRTDDSLLDRDGLILPHVLRTR